MRRRHRRHPHHHRPATSAPSRTTSTATSSSSTTSTSKGKHDELDRGASTSPSWPTSTTSARASRSASATPFGRPQARRRRPVRRPARRRHHGRRVDRCSSDMIDTYDAVRPLGGRAEGGRPDGDLALRLRPARARRTTTLVQILDIVEKPGRRRRRRTSRSWAATCSPRRSSTRSSRSSRASAARSSSPTPSASCWPTRPSTATTFDEGRFDTGKMLDYLQATVELALERPDLGPDFGVPGRPGRASRPDLTRHRRSGSPHLASRYASTGARVIPLEEARAPRRSTRCPPAGAGRRRRSRRARLRARRRRSSRREAVPPFANTAMDGFAVRAADVADAPATAPARCDVVGTLAAGAAADVEVGPGAGGADHDRRADAAGRRRRRDGRAHRDGERRRHRASVQRRGRRSATTSARPATTSPPATRSSPPGTVLTPAHLGVLASVGVPTSGGHPPAPRSACCPPATSWSTATGPLAPGQIRDSNRPMLARPRRAGRLRAVDLGTVADDEDAHRRRRCVDGAARCDAVVTSGGVSMGDFDYVKVVLDRIGDMRWMQIAIRPAKPLAFGVRRRRRRSSGCPATRCRRWCRFELFARPGAAPPWPATADSTCPASPPIADDGLAARARRQGPLRRGSPCRWRRRPASTPRSAGGQGSHQLAAMAAPTPWPSSPTATASPPGGDGRRRPAPDPSVLSLLTDGESTTRSAASSLAS